MLSRRWLGGVIDCCFVAAFSLAKLLGFVLAVGTAATMTVLASLGLVGNSEQQIIDHAATTLLLYSYSGRVIRNPNLFLPQTSVNWRRLRSC